MRAPTFFQRITPAGNIKTHSRDDFSYNRLLINDVIVFYTLLVVCFYQAKTHPPNSAFFITCCILQKKRSIIVPYIVPKLFSKK